MSKLGEILAWKLNQRFPPLAIHQELETAKRNNYENQKWAYAEAIRIVQGFEPYWDLEGKCVLDIGVGLGGKLPIYIEKGVGTATGIDIDTESVNIAHDYMSSLDIADYGRNSVQLLVSDAANLPFATNSFDAIISINVFEHIENLEPAIFEAYRVLKPAGTAFLHLPPYYSPWGPHLENWIRFPWPHLLFSEKTLMRVAEREDDRRHLNAEFVNAARIDWGASRDHIPNVNRVTLGQFQKLVRQAGFTILQLNLLPVGYDYLQQDNSLLKKMALQTLKWSTHVPLLREVVVTKMVYVLQKAKN